MQLSKLQGKRSLGLSALLAQRNLETRPNGPLQSSGDESFSDSKFGHSDDHRYPVEPTVPVVEFESHQQFCNLPLVSMSPTAEKQPNIATAVGYSTGTANWPIHDSQNSGGTATWNLSGSGSMAEVQQSHSQFECSHMLNTDAAGNGQHSTSQAEVNIFHQNSRDISAIFVDKQRKIIFELNTATASLKLQLQSMQQERDDFVLEVSTLNAAIEAQRHEQQTQLLSFSLKQLQDQATMRKLQDEIHATRGEINSYWQCLKDINEVAAPRFATGSLDASSIAQKITSICSRHFPENTHEKNTGTNAFVVEQELFCGVGAMMLTLDHDLAPHSEVIKPFFENMEKKHLEQQVKKELEISNLSAQIQHLEALNFNLQKQHAHAIFNSITVDEFARKNAKKCDEHESVIQLLQEELYEAHNDLKNHDVVLLHCLRDINSVRSDYATLEMERNLQYLASDRDLALKMQMSSDKVVESGEKIQNLHYLLSQKDSCIDDLRDRCEFLTSQNAVMMKKLFTLESSCSNAESALSRCKGELDIALLEKQMLTKIDEQRRLSKLQSSDSYHSQLELDYKASQETIDELRQKCDHYQASWFQFEKKTREEQREWQQTKEQELRFTMEVSMNERVGTIEAEMKNLRQKLQDAKAAQIVEISAIRNQLTRASNQAAETYAQKLHELTSQNESCMQRILQLQQLCQALQKGNFSKTFNLKPQSNLSFS